MRRVWIWREATEGRIQTFPLLLGGSTMKFFFFLCWSVLIYLYIWIFRLLANTLYLSLIGRPVGSTRVSRIETVLVKMKMYYYCEDSNCTRLCTNKMFKHVNDAYI
jgi:hypothetical protein